MFIGSEYQIRRIGLGQIFGAARKSIEFQFFGCGKIEDCGVERRLGRFGEHQFNFAGFA